MRHEENKIKPEELMLGNWVYGIDAGGFGPKNPCMFQVDDLNEKAINTWRVEGFGDEAAYGICGIELSPEILERCGFFAEKVGTVAQSYSLNGFMIDSGYTPFVNDPHEGFEIYIGEDLKYLHQLQNLYFALTNHHLTFKQQ